MNLNERDDDLEEMLNLKINRDLKKQADDVLRNINISKSEYVVQSYENLANGKINLVDLEHYPNKENDSTRLVVRISSGLKQTVKSILNENNITQTDFIHFVFEKLIQEKKLPNWNKGVD